MGKGVIYSFDDADLTVGFYRPFSKQNLYFSWQLNNRPGRFPEIYTNEGDENLGICLVNKGADTPFHALMTNGIPDFHLTGDSIYFPRWRYIPTQTLTQCPGENSQPLEQISNINPTALTQFREHYGEEQIGEDDLFYYSYGVLHSQQWRDTFADDLMKAPVRIPMAASVEDFRAFAEAGRELAELHINYESTDLYPLLEEFGSKCDSENPESYRVAKMSYLGPPKNPNRSGITCNSHITLSGIPELAHQYRLGSRSALDWIIERYQVKTDTNSGITNDPNDWASEHDNPTYIIDLIKRITTVSVRTMEIVQGLPQLPI